MKLIKIDEKGLFVEEAILDSIPQLSIEIINDNGETETVLVDDPLYIKAPCMSGFYHPKWDGEKWVEGLSKYKIDKLNSQEQAKTEIELLKEKNAQLEEIVNMLLVDSLGGV